MAWCNDSEMVGTHQVKTYAFSGGFPTNMWDTAASYLKEEEQVVTDDGVVLGGGHPVQHTLEIILADLNQ